jgi:hypothetical protein
VPLTELSEGLLVGKRRSPKGPQPTPLLARLLAHVSERDPSGCVRWRGMMIAGAPVLYLSEAKSGRICARRLAYALSRGSRRLPDRPVFTTCRWRDCVSPGHLTVRAPARGPGAVVMSRPRLETLRTTRLSWEKAAEIRAARAAGAGRRALATRFQVSVSAINHVLANRRWRQPAATGASTP